MIVLASFQGILRVYSPQKGGFKIDHMLMEKNFNLPILQIALGPFSAQFEVCIAVLHSRKLVVCAITST
jgi:hypothetical protein